METAVQCVEYLKRADLGRATFMAVDKMERHRSNAERRVSTPQDVPRLFDLVTPKDKKYSTCFYHALGEMLVANNLDQATEISLRGKTRHNVVTLQGHFISETGAMTGGGTRVIKGKMSSKIQSEYSPEEVKALKAKIESQESSFEQCRRNCSKLEDRISALEKEIAACRKRIKELVHQIQILAEQEKGTMERIKQTELQGTQNKIDPRELAKMEKEVAKYEKEYEKAAMAADEVKGIVQGLTEEIIRVGGSRLEQQQKFIDKIKEELKSSISSQSKAAVAIKSAERNAKKSREKIQSLDSDIRVIEEELEALYKELKDLEEEATEAKDKMNSAKEQIEEKNGEIAEIKKEIQDMEKQNRETNELMMDLKHELERYTARVKENQGKIEHFNNEIEKLALEDRPEFTDEDLENFDKQEGEYQITMLEERLSGMTPNMGAIEKYRRKEEELEKKKEELEAATREWEEARVRCEELRKRRHQEFMDGFTVISDKLKEMYQMITLGGDAELELVDSLDPFAEGITFSVRPPKKTWKCISNLSGGEKTLSSLALVFALHHYKPSPLYVMDEIDAALDCKNVSIVAHYIKERTKNAQFIIISLRNDMFELADRLVGIYKTYNCTKSVTVDPKKVEARIRSMALAC